MPLQENNTLFERLKKARQFGFRQCLDFIKESMTSCKTLKELYQIIERTESRIREGSLQQVKEELILF